VWSASTQLAAATPEQTLRARSSSHCSSFRFGSSGKGANPPSRFFNQRSLQAKIRRRFKEPRETGSTASNAQDLNQEAQ
jgi:hypothetical protein